MGTKETIEIFKRNVILVGPIGRALAAFLVALLMIFNGYMWRRVDHHEGQAAKAGIQREQIKSSIDMLSSELAIATDQITLAMAQLAEGGRFTCEQAAPFVLIVEAMLRRNKDTIDFEPRDLEHLERLKLELREACGIPLREKE